MCPWSLEVKGIPIPIGPSKPYIDLASLKKKPVIYYVVQILGSATFNKEL